MLLCKAVTTSPGQVQRFTTLVTEGSPPESISAVSTSPGHVQQVTAHVVKRGSSPESVLTVSTSPRQTQRVTTNAVKRATSLETSSAASSSPKMTQRAIPRVIKREASSDSISERQSVATSFTPLVHDGAPVAAKQDQPERGGWTGRFDFLLSLLGYSVGLGNVWRFPYLAYINGGGAFLLPFIIMLFLAGIPLMFMELAFGQYSSMSPTTIFGKFCPLFEGLGYSMVCVSCIVSLYYNMILAWTIFYIIAGFASELPWERCDPKWSSQNCYNYKDADVCHQKNGTVYLNHTCFDADDVKRLNITGAESNMTKHLPAEEYFNRLVLDISPGIDHLGGIRWQLALSLLAAWLITFVCLSKGVQSSGKVVYFTALFPYAILIILFVRGVTLPGSKEGILFYVTPNFSRLTDAKVWYDAAVQIFFSLSPAWGGLITLSSYNRFNNNCYKDALIVSLSNITTSIFAGFVVFSIVGFLAFQLNLPPDKVAEEGAGLAFIVFPEVITRLPITPLWSFLFFFMLLTLGLDSQFALMETISTAIFDRFPSLREKKIWVVLVASIFGFSFGLILCSRAGMYILQLMDNYAASWPVLIIAVIETLLIGWNYGAYRFLRQIEVMIGLPRSKLWFFVWGVLWKFLSPATLLFLLIFQLTQTKPFRYGDYQYPHWADCLGWVISFFPLLFIPGFMVYNLKTKTQGMPFCQKFKFLMQPASDWGPFEDLTKTPQHASAKSSKRPVAVETSEMTVKVTFRNSYKEKAIPNYGTSQTPSKYTFV